MLCCSSVSDVGPVVVAFEVVGCCISMGDFGIRLFAVSWGWCGIKWSHTLNCWVVLSGKTSLLYLLLCIEWMGAPCVTGFLLTYVLSCWLRCFCSPCGQKSSSAWMYVLRTKYLITMCFDNGYLQSTLEIAVQSPHGDCNTRNNTVITRHIT